MRGCKKMKLCRRKGFVFLLIGAVTLTLAGCYLGRAGRAQLVEQKVKEMKIFNLDDGMRVLVKENHGNPTVTLDLWVNTGSMNEPAEINGVSHFLEHMLFKGTEKRGVGEIDRMVESVGGRWNAGTSQDYTHFYVNVASQYFDTALDALSDVIMHSSLDPVELEKERLVVLEEYRRKQDNPMNFLYEQAFAESFDQSPYKAPVLGTPETIKAISRDKMLGYYRRYYTPDNIVLVVAGDVATDEVMPKIRLAFEPFKSRFEPYEALDHPTKRKSEVSEEFPKDVKESYLLLTFPAPGMDNPSDIYAMDVLSYILGEGRSSRLYREVKEKKQLVSSIGAAYGTQKRPGLFVVAATFSYDKLGEVKKAIEEEVEKLRRKEVPAKELAKAKRFLTNIYYFSNETNEGQAQTLGFYYTLSGGLDFEQQYLENVKRVSAADIQRVAQKYLDPKQDDLFVVRPKE
jgi:zinc protease